MRHSGVYAKVNQTPDARQNCDIDSDEKLARLKKREKEKGWGI
jgi:hypothetical protein